MERNTLGTQKVMCAIMSVAQPFPVNLVAAKRSIRDIPVTISGLIRGKFVTFLIRPFAVLFFMEYTPIAASVPSIVAITLATRATISVFIKDSIISSLEKSSLYHLREKPFHE